MRAYGSLKQVYVMTGDSNLVAYPRKEFATSAVWDTFVDKHPSGAWWHRQAWIDYSLAYDRKTIDRSFAVVSESAGYPFIVGLCPAIERDGVVCMGDDPCAGPLISTQGKLSAARSQACHDAMVSSIKKMLGGIEVQWRWNRYPNDYRNTIGDLAESLGLKYETWDTSVVKVWGGRELGVTARDVTHDSRCRDEPMRQWLSMRKSYRSLIKKTAREHTIGWGTDYLWPHFELCHRQTATRPRDGETYKHQLKWLRQGHAYIMAAFPKIGGTEGAMDQDGLVASPLSWPVVGSSPTPSTILSAAYVIAYKGHGYYASGPSLKKGLQHALQWGAMQVMSNVLHGDSYEVGWLKEDGIGFFKGGFGGDRCGVDVLRGTI